MLLKLSEITNSANKKDKIQRNCNDSAKGRGKGMGGGEEEEEKWNYVYCNVDIDVDVDIWIYDIHCKKSDLENVFIWYKVK